MDRTHKFRSATILATCGLLIAVVGGCSTTANLQDSVAGKPNTPPPALPACSAAQVTDTKSYVASYARELITSQQLMTGWDGKTPLIDVPASVEAATKTAMLPCIPAVDVASSANNPENVKLIQKVIDLQLWSKLLIPAKVGAGNQSNAPKVTGFTDPKESYRAFLTSAARMPYFCGEKGQWSSPIEACKRELSTFFAHAIQETGEKPVPAGEELWQTALFQTREGVCWPNDCTQYNGGAEKFDAPKDVSYYGRGIKQLSWVYNYAAFSAAYYGDMDVLVNDPDLVATDPNLVLGSGLWFAMQPQPTKPSMHDVVTGIFQPHDMPPSKEYLGVKQAADKSIVEKFSATVSIINGAYECSPTTGGPEAVYLHIAQSMNRFTNYKTLLPLFGVPEAEQTANERAIVPGKTYCEIAAGNPWTVASSPGVIPLGWQVPFYLDMGAPESGVAGTCLAVGYGQSVPLTISAPGSANLCRTKFMGNKSPTTSTTAPAPSGASASQTTPPANPDANEVTATNIEGDMSVTVIRNGAGWSSGYCTQVAAKSIKGAAVTKWSFYFQLPNGATPNADGWDSTIAKSGAGYVFTPTPWSEKIGAGATVNGGGFCVEGSRDLPSNIVITSVH